MVRPLVQKLQYQIAIITRGVDTMTRETRMLADALIKALDDDTIIRSLAP